MLVRLLPFVLLCLAALSDAAAAQSPPTGPSDRAVVYFDGNPLFDVRGVSALPAEQRARIVRDRLREAAEDSGFDPSSITVTPIEDGLEIAAPGRPLVNVYPADAAMEDVSQHILARVIRDRVAKAITDYRAARTAEGVNRAIREAVWWTVAYAVALVALVAAGRAALGFTDRHIAARIAVWEARAQNVVRLTSLWRSLRVAVEVGFVLLGLFATYVWLDGVLLALPWTREVGREALARIASPVTGILGGIAGAIPDLIALALIAALTVGGLRIMRRLFAMIGAGTVRFRGFEPEWAAPTERLVRILLILFAAIMAYPYVPGSSTEAFKAIGIFAGLLFSLGASSIVANLVAGQTLIYRRAFRVGDRVEIAGVTGDLEEIGTQATYLRTPKNERVTIPNAIVLTAQVTNYTHFAREHGLILHTEVGIGYEVAWQEVEAMLLEAARRTPGTLAEPAPFVLQKKLGDYSPVYELNVYVHDAQEMLNTYSVLHAAIQDVFAERGVQIMTPSYMADPAQAKVPPVSHRA